MSDSIKFGPEVTTATIRPYVPNNVSGITYTQWEIETRDGSEPKVPRTEVAKETKNTGDANPSPTPVVEENHKVFINDIKETVKAVDSDGEPKSTGQLYAKKVTGWFSSDFAEGMPDGHYAVSRSEVLEANDFGAEIPENASISGIIVRVKRKALEPVVIPHILSDPMFWEDYWDHTTPPIQWEDMYADKYTFGSTWGTDSGMFYVGSLPVPTEPFDVAYNIDVSTGYELSIEYDGAYFSIGSSGSGVVTVDPSVTLGSAQPSFNIYNNGIVGTLQYGAEVSVWAP